MNSEIIIPVVIVTLLYAPLIFEFIKLVRENKFENRFRIKKLKKKLKITSLIIFLVILSIAVISHTNYLDYQSPMKYSDVDNITFQNFRGIELFKKSLYGNKRFAYIHTTIDSEINKDHVIIESYFHPSRSFVYKRNIFDKDLLTHEIYHFKITEVFVRKAKKEISELSIQDTKSIKEVIEKYSFMENSYQKEYDYNTFHSYVLSEQKRYQESIDSLLYLLSDFKNSKISITK